MLDLQTCLMIFVDVSFMSCLVVCYLDMNWRIYCFEIFLFKKVKKRRVNSDTVSIGIHHQVECFLSHLSILSPGILNPFQVFLNLTMLNLLLIELFLALCYISLKIHYDVVTLIAGHLYY